MGSVVQNIQKESSDERTNWRKTNKEEQIIKESEENEAETKDFSQDIDTKQDVKDDADEEFNDAFKNLDLDRDIDTETTDVKTKDCKAMNGAMSAEHIEQSLRSKTSDDDANEKQDPQQQ